METAKATTGETKMIVRSTTGKYHVAPQNPAHAGGPWCNVNMRVRPAIEAEVRAAGAHMFCDKCFITGRHVETIDRHFGKKCDA